MPILGADFQGNQPVDLGVIEVLKKLTQPQMPPPTQEEQAIRMKTKAIGSLVNDFSGSLGSIGEDTKKSLTQSFMKSLLNPKTAEAGQSTQEPQAQLKSTMGGRVEDFTAKKGQEGKPSDKPNILWEVLKRVGVPGLAAVLGSTGAMPLAGAAGLGTGYVKGMQSAEEIGLEKEKINYTKAEKNETQEQKENKQDLDNALEFYKDSVRGGLQKGTTNSDIVTKAAEFKKIREEIKKRARSGQSTGEVPDVDTSDDKSDPLGIRGNI
uniref:Uncharacterized protein n=1 Tax=viral metagenome TaxID=1070528 RepID=A0A6M3KGJ9_9ZZZZ